MADQKIKPLSKYSILDREEFERIFGFEASRSEGRKEGIEIGESREQKTIASRMLKKGKALEEIAEDTQLSIAQLQALKLELGL